MHAIRQSEFGGPERLVLEEMADLVPAPGQVRIDVHAAGVHLIDTRIREGIAMGPFPLPTLPMTPGREVAGVVDAVGPTVDEAWLGRRVVASLGPASGGYASSAVAEVGALHPLDAATDFGAAVAMVGTGRTALGILAEAAITEGDRVLVTAAVGGIGALLVQAARRAGAVVVAAVGGAAKVAVAEGLGADVVVDYSDESWAADLAERLDRRTVTIALDGVGGAIGRSAFEQVAPGGRMVLYGFASGAPMPLSAGDVLARGVAVSAGIGARVLARPGGIEALSRQALDELASGRLVPLVHPPFALADAAAAHRALEGRATAGKVILVP